MPATSPLRSGTDLFEDLRWRSLVQDVSDEDGLIAALSESRVTLYAGYDPTASSLHVGNLQIIMLQRRFQLAGHNIVVLTGGGTGLIGDPSGKADERRLNSAETVAAWTEAIRGQLSSLLASADGLTEPVFVDNVEWIGAMTAVEMLRDVGKHFPLGYMLAKQSVADRLHDEARGISFTEFTYMLLQALDFQVLFDRVDCRLQIGGSDQWGNITAGLELLRRTGRPGAFGLTSPLMMRSDGAKFGKSERGAVWLDRSRTSPFSFYQYFFNARDDDVGVLLRRLSLRPRDEIEQLEDATRTAPAERRAQRALAEELTRFVHGADGLSEAIEVTEWLFGGGSLAEGRDIEAAVAGAAIATADPDQWSGWESILVQTGLASSGSDARRIIAGGGAYVNDRRITALEQACDSADFPHGGIAVLRKGRRHRALVRHGSAPETT